MIYYVFTIQFLRGDIFNVVAETEREAFDLLHLWYPQTVGWDLYQVTKAEQKSIYS